MRIVVACLAATVLVMGLHIPHGSWIIWTIFQVSSEDAGASLRKGALRIVGTLIGGLVGILIVIAFADEPQFMFVSVGVAVAVSMFLTRTTSAPDAGLLVAFTMLLVVTSRLDSPGTEIDTALWRILVVLVGVVLGTGAQLVLWPRDPEQRLLDEIVQRLADVEGLLARAVGARPDTPEHPRERDLVARSGFARELDILANAEARYPSLRRRHTEQIALITETERLLTNSLWLVELTTGPSRAYRIDDRIGSRLQDLGAACARLRLTLAARQPTASEDVPYPAEGPVESGVGLETLIAYMEGALARVSAATGFLNPLAAGAARLATRRSPLDSSARAPLLTPAFSLTNTADIKFALKCAFAVEICLLIALGLDWPGLLTAGVTCLIIAQSTLGASVYKALLRLAGAVLGGLLGLIVIAVVMPNMEGLGWLMPPVAACFWMASWLVVGSPRISYAGLQAGIAFGIAVLDVFGPTTDLVPPRDRVLGIVLGIVVMGVIQHFIWPVQASRAVRPALAAALRVMAQLAELTRTPGTYASNITRAARHRATVYRGLGTVLRLREESLLEPGASAPAAQAERDRILDLAGDAQGSFLALLALARHRLQTDAASVPKEAVTPLADFDRGVRQALEVIADALDGNAIGPLPDLREALDTLGRMESSFPPAPPSLEAPMLTHFRREVAIRRSVLDHLERLSRRVRR
jgi:multidrug resistance protein MdtO